MICPKCKAEIEEGAFCSECGERLEIPVNTEPAAKITAPPAVDKKAKKWPIAIPLLLLAAALLALVAQAFGVADIIMTRYPINRLLTDIRFSVGSMRGFSEWTFPVLSLFPLVGAVLFFIRTKKAAPVTAIPYLICGIAALVTGINKIRIGIPAILRPLSMGMRFRFGYAVDIVLLFSILIPAVLALIYLMGTIVKLRFPLFALLYLLAAAVMIVLSAVGDVRWGNNCVDRVRDELLRLRVHDFRGAGIVFKHFMSLYGRDAFLRLFRWLSAAVTHIACFIALLACRKKKA